MTFRYSGQDHAGVLTAEGLVPVLEINAKHDLHIPNTLLEIIQNDIRDIPVHGVRPIPLSDVEPRLPYNVPPKIWCIGQRPALSIRTSVCSTATTPFRIWPASM